MVSSFADTSFRQSKKLLTSLSVSLLGAINGLLVGVIVEEARVSYLSRQMSRAARDFAKFAKAEGGGYTFVEPSREVLIPFVCIVAFAATSYLVHRYFISRPQALVLVWLILGAVAIWAGYFMSTSSPGVFSFMWLLTFAFVSYSVHWLWKIRPQSFLLLWLVIGISAVIVVAFGVQLIGLLFYWPELRSSLLWLLCLAVIIVINSIYAAVIQLFLTRYRRGEITHSNP